MNAARNFGKNAGKNAGKSASNSGRRHLLVLLASLLTGCASTYRVEPERLIGSWQNRTVVTGQPGSSMITFRSDGNFEELRSQLSVSTGQPLRLQGNWTLIGDRLRMFYLAGFEGHGTPQVETRVVSRLSERDFVSADINFGAELWRTRVTQKSAPKP